MVEGALPRGVARCSELRAAPRGSAPSTTPRRGSSSSCAAPERALHHAAPRLRLLAAGALPLSPSHTHDWREGGRLIQLRIAQGYFCPFALLPIKMDYNNSFCVQWQITIVEKCVVAKTTIFSVMWPKPPFFSVQELILPRV